LIAAVKTMPNIKIIVFDWRQAHRINLLFDELHIDGYVLKGRNTIYDLKEPFKSLQKMNQKIFLLVVCTCFNMTTSEINNYDVQLIKYLSRGMSQENIEAVFKWIQPSW
jgi:hypothetical protein